MRKKELKAPASVAADFSSWCSPKRGRANPERQTNDVWSWLVRTRAWPHAAHAVAGTGQKASPGWCFSRFGQSETRLPDGTTVFIGGEHEDHYDPDFYIYNDVVVVRPDSSIDIYGYPTDIFAPTDFHSATLVGEEILIIGGLRYPEDRKPGDTWIYRLQLSDFSIHRVTARGHPPPWLYRHHAEMDREHRRIVCTGGEATHHQTGRVVENLTTWEFDLETKFWRATATKSFTRWLLVREDNRYNNLWGIKQVADATRSSRWGKVAEEYRVEFKERGHVVDADLFYSRFSPPVPHCIVEPDPESDEFRVHRIMVDGVVVRYVEDMHEIAVTVEGKLNSDKLETLKRHGLETYSNLEGVAYKAISL